MANEAQKQAFFRDWKDAPKDPAEALAFQQGWYKGYDAHESAIRTAANETIERLTWVVTACTVDRDAKHELKSVIDDLKTTLETGKEGLSPYHTIVPTKVSATFVGHVNPPTDGKEKE